MIIAAGVLCVLLGAAIVQTVRGVRQALRIIRLQRECDELRTRMEG